MKELIDKIIYIAQRVFMLILLIPAVIMGAAVGHSFGIFGSLIGIIAGIIAWALIIKESFSHWLSPEKSTNKKIKTNYIPARSPKLTQKPSQLAQSNYTPPAKPVIPPNKNPCVACGSTTTKSSYSGYSFGKPKTYLEYKCNKTGMYGYKCDCGEHFHSPHKLYVGTYIPCPSCGDDRFFTHWSSANPLS